MSKYTFTIDWEDFGQLYCKYIHGSISKPLQDIDRQTNIILELLSVHNVKATFFVLGLLAKFRPDLVNMIKNEGHEIALHGQIHSAMFNLSRKEQEKDIQENYKLVTDITGEQVFGYRAPFFSMKKSNIYLLEILSELGLTYDSSIFPMRFSKYSINNFNSKSALYQLPNNKTIVELPVSTHKYLSVNWPISGGSYIRIVPFWLLKWIFSNIDKNQRDIMLYMHPYEFDVERIDISSNFPKYFKYPNLKKNLLNLRWNFSRNTIGKKMDYLFKKHEFITCKEKADYVKSETHLPTVLE